MQVANTNNSCGYVVRDCQHQKNYKVFPKVRMSHEWQLQP